MMDFGEQASVLRKESSLTFVMTPQYSIDFNFWKGWFGHRMGTAWAQSRFVAKKATQDGGRLE